MEYLRSIDMFGHTVNFSINGKPQYQTLIGAFFSISTLTVAIVFSFIFGRDFFYRLNPKISSRTAYYKHGVKANLSPEKFNFAWRIINTSGKDDLNSMIYNLIYFIKFTQPNKYEIKNMNATRCTAENSPSLQSKFPHFLNITVWILIMIFLKINFWVGPE